MRVTAPATILTTLGLFSLSAFLPQLVWADCAQITQTPNIYQANQVGSQATLYFTPVNVQTTGYTINYGLWSGDDRYNVDFASGNSSGAVTYTVGSLDTASHYFFRVRAKNACSTGPYGSWVAATKGSSIAAAGTVLAQDGLPVATPTAALNNTTNPIQTPVTGPIATMILMGLSVALFGLGIFLFLSTSKKRII